MRKVFMIFLFVLFAIALGAPSAYAAYDGPKDPRYYRQPQNVMCQGIPNYPKGANLWFAKSGSVGNLLDGFSYAYTEGQVGILYFSNMTETSVNSISGVVTGIDVLKGFEIVFKELPVTCRVSKWYS